MSYVHTAICSIVVFLFSFRWVKAMRYSFSWLPNLSGFSCKDEDIVPDLRDEIKDDPMILRRHHAPWGFIPAPNAWRDFQVWLI